MMQCLNECVMNMLQGGEQTQQSTWSEVASIISTVAWSVSFYGQVYQNWKYKSVQGFSLDYLYLNLIGYSFYGIYSTIGYFTDIKGAGIFSFYKLSLKGTVLLGDLIFVYHAIPIVIVEAIQCCYYPRGNNRLSQWAKFLGIGLIVFCVLEFVFTSVIELIQWTEYWNPVSVLGYAKLVISFVKYSPAVYWNWKRKSTKGWSIFNILLDLVGGGTSLASGSISVQNGLNVTKLFLAILTVVYDMIFIIQHYVLYRQKDTKQDQERKLIENEGIEHISDLVTVSGENSINQQEQQQNIHQDKQNNQRNLLTNDNKSQQ